MVENSQIAASTMKGMAVIQTLRKPVEYVSRTASTPAPMIAGEIPGMVASPVAFCATTSPTY